MKYEKNKNHSTVWRLLYNHAVGTQRVIAKLVGKHRTTLRSYRRGGLNAFPIDRKSKKFSSQIEEGLEFYFKCFIYSKHLNIS